MLKSLDALILKLNMTMEKLDFFKNPVFLLNLKLCAPFIRIISMKTPNTIKLLYQKNFIILKSLVVKGGDLIARVFS